MNNTYENTIIGFQQIIRFFLDNNINSLCSILIILTIMNHEKEFQKVIIDQSTTPKKDIIFFKTLSRLIEALMNMFYQTPHFKIEHFINDCTKHYLIT
jgi:hypothetical protein